MFILVYHHFALFIIVNSPSNNLMLFLFYFLLITLSSHCTRLGFYFTETRLVKVGRCFLSKKQCKILQFITTLTIYNMNLALPEILGFSWMFCSDFMLIKKIRIQKIRGKITEFDCNRPLKSFYFSLEIRMCFLCLSTQSISS